MVSLKKRKHFNPTLTWSTDKECTNKCAKVEIHTQINWIKQDALKCEESIKDGQST